MPKFDGINHKPDYSTRKGRGKSQRTKTLESLGRVGSSEEEFEDNLTGITLKPEDPLYQFAIKEVSERLTPKTKPVAPLVEFEFDKDASPFDQCMQVINAASTGNLPTDISQSIIAQVKTALDIHEMTEVAERVKKIEESLGLETK
jgi:hypothetical protein